ncbi:hypothetical protein L6164_009695 [Bauhinia variegata]|uniref:Uncharacterized protein n=1 Tax=Bauhinia variegata TaxID=167791 RepID=A0ACB9PKH3_BAUVA|nr:hypothetical protein L6164_009695 [Bauhinia variegata]
MDWNGSIRPFVPRADSSLSFLYNYNYSPYPGMEVKHSALAETPQGFLLSVDKMNYGNQLEKKKRLTVDQLDSLERSFQEELKLDPDRKMKLSRELGLQPRQIAVWFQNRRARWKTKQLENSYDALRQEFDVISKENQKLQEEVTKLRAVLRQQTCRAQASAGYTEISGDETVESSSEAMPSSSKQVAEGNYSFTVDDYNTVSLPYWAGVPHYP